MNTEETRRKTIQALRSRGLIVPMAFTRSDRVIPAMSAPVGGGRPGVGATEGAQMEVQRAGTRCGAKKWDEAPPGRRADAASAEIESRKSQEAERKRQEAEKEEAAWQESQLAKPRRAFLAAGGTPEAWDAVKKEIAAEIAKQAAVKAAIGA